MNVNELRELMKFADENEMFGRGWNDSASSYNPKGRRAQWAADMMGRPGGAGMAPAPDFYADEGPAPAMRPYQAPERFAPTQPRQGGMGQTLRPQVVNYLAKFMGGR